MKNIFLIFLYCFLIFIILIIYFSPWVISKTKKELSQSPALINNKMTIKGSIPRNNWNNWKCNFWCRFKTKIKIIINKTWPSNSNLSTNINLTCRTKWPLAQISSSSSSISSNSRFWCNNKDKILNFKTKLICNKLTCYHKIWWR